MTSGSAMSCDAISFSASRTTSAESRTMTMFSFSSTTTSRALVIVLTLAATLVASGVAEVETAHHHLAILGRLGLRVRIDQQGVAVEHPAVELVGGEDEADDVLDRFVGDPRP